MPREMRVVPYKRKWRSLFDAERSLVEKILGDRLAAIHHIGSTAVEGLAAKPVIDILVVVNRMTEVDERIARFQDVGYENKGEFGIKGRIFLRKGGDENPTHHIHVFAAGDPNVQRHIAFRDYLRSFPKIRDEYGDLKRKGAATHRFDSEGYMAYKESFIKKTEAQALSWFNQSKNIEQEKNAPKDQPQCRISNLDGVRRA
jgi:GrpB-like predicted nucleotidyltransferase (UPF0157 family)